LEAEAVTLHTHRNPGTALHIPGSGLVIGYPDGLFVSAHPSMKRI
jgi:hypothetical protein